MFTGLGPVVFPLRERRLYRHVRLFTTAAVLVLRRVSARKHFGLLAIMAQALEVDDRHAAIFEPQHAFLLQSLQTRVRILPGNT
jgi:hypothetical protein